MAQHRGKNQHSERYKHKQAQRQIVVLACGFRHGLPQKHDGYTVGQTPENYTQRRHRHYTYIQCRRKQPSFGSVHSLSFDQMFFEYPTLYISITRQRPDVNIIKYFIIRPTFYDIITHPPPCQAVKGDCRKKFDKKRLFLSKKP